MTRRPGETRAAGQPRMPRRPASSAESARGLLFTVLGEFVLASGGTAWTSSFIEVFGRMGIEEKATRQALMRTAADGWLKAERVGRRTLWHLTPTAERLLTEGSERIYGFTAAAPQWDGRWLIILARVPETGRPARHLLRTRLGWAGSGSPAPGVWISPHVSRIEEAESVLAEAGLSGEAQVFIAEHHPSQPDDRLTAMVRQSWDLDALEDRYQAFTGDFGGYGDGSRVTDPLVLVISLVHAWRRFPRTDPALPTALLPPLWRGVEAARLFNRLHTRWSADAANEWHQLNQRPGGRGSGDAGQPAGRSSTRADSRARPRSAPTRPQASSYLPIRD